MRYFIQFSSAVKRSLVIFVLLILSVFQSYSQCGGGGTLTGNLLMLPTFQTISVNAGQRYTFTGYAQTTYVFSFCTGGGSTTIDTQIEICNQAGTVVYAYNDDFCNFASEVIWIAPANGTYSVVIHQHYCQNNGTPAGTMAYMTITPPNAQDCLGAIPLCFNTYFTNNSYSGTGHYTGEIPDYPGANSDNNCPGNCLLDGELNDVWYIFTVQNSGTVAFTITPNNSSDDYDWSVYNLTNAQCVDIATQADALQASCNFCGTSGTTGPNDGSALDCQAGNSCTTVNDALNVTTGQTYVVNVSNFSATQSGYTITFGGTAQILDNSGPQLVDLLYPPMCGSSSITVQFSEQIWCSGTDPGDFLITGPAGQYVVNNVWSPVCLAGLGSSYGDTYYDDVWTLELADYLQHDGDYTLEVLPGSIMDICGNLVNTSVVVHFHIDGVNASAFVIDGEECYGASDGSATVNTVTGGTTPYSYAWTGGETTQTAIVLPGGQVYVTVTDSTGICHDIIPLTIPQPAQILVDAGPNQTVCPGGSVPIGGSPSITNGIAPLSYGWTPTTGLSNPALLNPIATPAATTTYILTVLDNTGCTASDAVTVTVYANASVNLGPDIQPCTSSLPLTLNAGAGYTNYNWSVDLYDGSQTMPVSTSGNYSVTVTNTDGCSATDNILVTVVSNPSVNLGIDQIVCGSNLPFTLNAGPGYAVYDWNIDTYDGSQTMPVNATGSYSVTVSDGAGCSGTDQISITIDPAININLVSINPLCYGTATGSINAIVSGGTPPYQYYWSNAQTTAVISGLSAGVAYGVTVSDAANCTVSATATLINPPQLTATVTTQPTECGQSIGSATVTASGGTGAYTYHWNNLMNTIQITDLNPGTFYCTVNDANNCSVTASGVVGVYGSSDVVITELQPVLCNGGATGVLQGTMTDGFGGPYQYQWSGSAQNSSVINNLTAGVYSITITDGFGCTGTATHTIYEQLEVVVTADIVDILCRGGNDGSITLTVTGGVPPYYFNWSNGANSSHISNLTGGAYSVAITDVNNCVYQGFYTVEQPDKVLDVSLLQQNVICFNENSGAALATGDGGTPPYTIVWYENGTIIGNGAQLNALPAGTYQVVVKDVNNCEARRYLTITEPAELFVDYIVTPATCMGNDDGLALVSVIGGTAPYEFEWSTGDMVALLENTTSGQYNVSITDANNCTKTLNVYIPESSNLCLRIPNAFTPNDDGVNDTWIIDYIEKYPLSQVYVFNRWGQKIYDKNMNEGPWDGTFEGNNVPTGSYTYIVDLHNGMEPFTGVVVVVH